MKLAEGRDCRMVHCVLDGYIDCPAKCPEACICNQMPPWIYEQAYKRKFKKGESDEKDA